ncbi:hypothetical protein FD27_GL001213 [Limosilactobacillus frumenti DSM 13145]|uniref:DUF5067 domain-containing protein n=1 Tax=Limosilactobacillus frumenti DSM 13145 TaxID=1423746 RepID=A0A0R1PCY9_9LACO|nr:DUF5067 domain-containing protein [Limosilactobacillus frumenti]KRL27450.1 hypothetical protein FD27_GL001213 [Limosilactobacillus frumenti DSM 13145]QFG72886.1 DUF5067 domain-containing protein [Limosilactobacillus frumenti]
MKSSRMQIVYLIFAIVISCFSLSACGTLSSTKKSSSNYTTYTTKEKYYFNGTTANLHDIKIHIDKVQIYKASETTNNKNLVCFDYTITNKTDKDINAIEGWQSVFNAYQDNKNTEDKLEVCALPPDTSNQVLHDQNQAIKKNGTVQCRAAYNFDSNKKSIILKATKGSDSHFLGKRTYRLDKLKTINVDQDNDSISANKSTSQNGLKPNTISQTVSNSSNKSDNRHSGDWHNDPELWNDAQNDDNWNGSMYQNATPQQRYDYIEANHDYWASRDPNYYNE